MIDLGAAFYMVDFHDYRRVAMIVTAMVALTFFMRLVYLPKVWMKVIANFIFWLLIIHIAGFTIIGLGAWSASQ